MADLPTPEPTDAAPTDGVHHHLHFPHYHGPMPLRHAVRDLVGLVGVIAVWTALVAIVVR